MVWHEEYTLKDFPFLAWRLTFSPDGKTLVTQASEPEVRLWEVATGDAKGALLADNNAFHAFLGFTPDSRELVTAGEDVWLWDAATHKQIAHFPGGPLGPQGTLAQLAPDGKWVAAISANGAVRLIDVSGRQERKVFSDFPVPARRLAFSPNSTRLAAGLEDGTVLVWDLATLKQTSRLEGKSHPTLDLAFSPDGSLLATLHRSANDPDAQAWGEAQVWQVATGRTRALPTPNVSAVAFAPVGNTLASLAGDGTTIWDPATGERQLLIPARPVRIIFSPDGKEILTPSQGRAAQLRDTTTGRVLATFKGHNGALTEAAFSADGQWLATGSSIIVNPNKDRKADVKVWKRSP
jgi:WD40 repeat protein